MFIYLQFLAEFRLYFTAGRSHFTAGRLHFTAGRMQKKRPAVKAVLANQIASFSWIKKIKQLLDETEYDINNYSDLGQCYPH